MSSRKWSRRNQTASTVPSTGPLVPARRSDGRKPTHARTGAGDVGAGVSGGIGAATRPHGVGTAPPSMGRSNSVATPRNRATVAELGARHTSRAAPVWATRPRSRITTVSARVNASSRSWVTSSVGLWLARMMRCSSIASCSRRSRSTDARGSSSINNRGDGASARASATRCCSPPDSWSTLRDSYPASPTSWSTSATRRAVSARGWWCIRNPNATFPSTV